MHEFVHPASRLVEHGTAELLGLRHDRLLRAAPRATRLPGTAASRSPEFKTHGPRALHDAGLEVLLDVVYNHTAEGGTLGPTLSFRGIDNHAYYRLVPDDPSTTSTRRGPATASTWPTPRSLGLVMDSLRYWVTECHVDGFRFDLAATLARPVLRGRPALGLLRPRRAGSRPEPGEADRGALGSRRRRLPGGSIPPDVVRVERQVPRHGSGLLARW